MGPNQHSIVCFEKCRTAIFQMAPLAKAACSLNTLTYERRAMLDKYKRKVSAGYYEQFRPRCMRERLDELCHMVHKLLSGQALEQASVSRMEHSRAYGDMLHSEELALHRQRFNVLNAEGVQGSHSGACVFCLCLTGSPQLYIVLACTTDAAEN